MCLSTISRTKPPETGYFYKVFRLSFNGNINGQFFPKAKNLKRGTWLKASKDTIAVVGGRWNSRTGRWNSDRHYKAGFHGYVNLKDAIKATRFRSWLVIIKCRYSEGHTQGSQKGKIIVASKMRIPKNPVDLSKNKRQIRRIP